MAVKRYNATLRNLEYRLRSFKDSLPMLLEDIVRDKEDVILSAIADDQLYRRGINGRGEKIMDYMPYKPKTIQITPELIEKYGEEIFRLTDKNFTRIIRSHIRKELVKRLKQAIRK